MAAPISLSTSANGQSSLVVPSKRTSSWAATILHYEVNAQVGGKIAQLGARLIDGTAKKLAGDFFTTFSKAVAPADSSIG